MGCDIPIEIAGAKHMWSRTFMPEVKNLYHSWAINLEKLNEFSGIVWIKAHPKYTMDQGLVCETTK